MYSNLIVPGLFIVIDNCSSETPSRIDTCSGDGNCGQVNHEHCESDGKGSQNLNKSNKIRDGLSIRVSVGMTILIFTFP